MKNVLKSIMKYKNIVETFLYISLTNLYNIYIVKINANCVKMNFETNYELISEAWLPV